jgi:hypothetical protein
MAMRRKKVQLWSGLLPGPENVGTAPLQRRPRGPDIRSRVELCISEVTAQRTLAFAPWALQADRQLHYTPGPVSSSLFCSLVLPVCDTAAGG